MRESFDILPRESVEAYDQYLKHAQESLDGLMTETKDMARTLDGCDENNFTVKMAVFLSELAESVKHTAGMIFEVTEKLLQELEAKNDSVGSSAQEDNISMLKNQAQRLLELIPFQECELTKGGNSFSDEEKETLQKDLAFLTDDWEAEILQLKQEAESLNDENEQNELSGVYFELAQVLEGFLNDMSESIERAGHHLDNLADSYRIRKQAMTSQAAGEFSREAQKLKQKMAEAAEQFAGLEF